MSAYKILSLLLLCAIPFISQAQLSGETQDESLLASAQIVELDAKQQPEALNSWGPPTAEQLDQLEGYGWLPLQQEEVQGALVCTWGNSDTGITCPSGAAHCIVVVNLASGTAGLQCMSGNQAVSGVHLRRPFP